MLILSTMYAQQNSKEYIKKYSDIAMTESKRSCIPYAIIMGQALLESQIGKSKVAIKGNNHFGIKCRSKKEKDFIVHTDDKPNEHFRKYPRVEDSYRDHSNILMTNSRYAFLFKLDAQDYKGWAVGLHTAGYATNPKYADILMEYIKANNLDQNPSEPSSVDSPVQDDLTGLNDY